MWYFKNENDELSTYKSKRKKLHHPSIQHASFGHPSECRQAAEPTATALATT